MIDNELEKNIENVSLNDDEDLTTRHKRERKELQAKIQALKKTAGKGDKKKKKEVLEEIARLEIDLDKKHADELENVEQNSKNSIEQDNNRNDIEAESNHFNEKGARVSRAQKRREKKAVEEKNREAECAAQEELNKSGPRAIEMQTIKKLLAQRNLALHPISSDGNCLYNGICDLSSSFKVVRNNLKVNNYFSDTQSTNGDWKTCRRS